MPLFLFSIFGVFCADQVTKILVRSRMALGDEIPLLPVFSITHVDNTGIAFGMFQERNVFFIALGICVTAILIYYAVTLLRTDRGSAIAMAAILGGASGNIVDRIVYGRVTDFLDFHAGMYHWPVFNVADSAICLGAFFVALHTYLQWRAGAHR